MKPGLQVQLYDPGKLLHVPSLQGEIVTLHSLTSVWQVVPLKPVPLQSQKNAPTLSWHLPPLIHGLLKWLKFFFK